MHHAHVVLTTGDSIRLTQATAGKEVTPLAHRRPGRTPGDDRTVLLAITGQNSLALDTRPAGHRQQHLVDPDNNH